MGSGALRNQSCFCGSGKKLKKCCLQKEAEISDADEVYEKMKAMGLSRRTFLAERGIFINVPTPVVMGDKKYWAVGSRVYYRPNIKETFHEFIVWILGETIGFDWFKEESKKGHVLKQWVDSYFLWQKEYACDENRVDGLWAYYPDGFSKSLVCLAFDVFILKHTGDFPESYIKRLRDPKQFQGVRYEIAVASIFARMGFHLRFLDNAEIVSKHCEFYVLDVDGEIVVAVEAKSKHRGGVLNFQGERSPEITVSRSQFDALFKRARQQNPGNVPFIIFMDVNAPQEPDKEGLEKTWIKEMMRMVGAREITPENPDSITGIVFTNHSYHYQEKNQAISGENCMAISMRCKHPVGKVSNFWDLLKTSVDNYGQVPNLDVEYGE